jgi:acyl carrier protein
VSEEERRDPSVLWKLILRHKIERLFLPVVILDHLAEAAVSSGHAAPALQEVITAGEQLRLTPIIREFFKRHPGVTLHNQYGPTETHVVTAHRLAGDADTWPTLPPIGRPIDSARIYLLDQYGQLVPPGVVGELFVGGVSLARGYWNKPKLTWERFLQRMIANGVEERLYRTGDLARFLPDGSIEYLGRRDSQVKIRGYRIELEEIESILQKLPGVRQAVAATQGDGSSKRLVAYIVPEESTVSADEAWTNQLRRELPEYMVPSAFAILEELPLSPNGKVDRRLLPEVNTSRPRTSQSPSDHQDLLELKLIRIWQWLFKRPDVGREDNFFDLGGHSLLAARLAAEIERLFGLRIPIAAMFQAPTLAGLAQMIRDRNWAPPMGSLVALQAGGQRPPFFFAHGWGGDVYCFLSLARLLAPDQPMYGLQAIGLDGRKPRQTRIEEMAADYVKELRDFQPNGPYYLGGYSLGGWVAYEMAQQLTAQGQEVATIILLDTVALGPLPWPIHLRMMPSLLGDRI